MNPLLSVAVSVIIAYFFSHGREVLGDRVHIDDHCALRIAEHVLVCRMHISHFPVGKRSESVSLLLEICSHIGHHDRTVKDGKWENNIDWCYWDYPLIELYGKTAGIIGLGRIGKTTAGILGAMGMKVLAHDSFESEEGRKLAEYVDLDTLYSSSDVIFLHCPLFADNEKMINKDSIAKMKDGVIIINNSRGGLVNEQDLADALNTGKVYAAGLDVVSTEPIKGDNPLLKARNCIITPHISWAAQAARQRIMDITADNIKAFIDGSPVNVVNL